MRAVLLCLCLLPLNAAAKGKKKPRPAKGIPSAAAAEEAPPPVAPEPPVDHGEEKAKLEKELERSLAGASQGSIPAQIALRAAERMIQLEPKEPPYHFARGVALHHLMRFDEALNEFAEAKKLGMEDGHSWNAGNGLAEWRAWSQNARTMIAPVHFRVPDNDHYEIGVRYRSAGVISKIAEANVAGIAKLGKELFGSVPEHTTLFILTSVAEADELQQKTGFDLRADGSGRRPDAYAFGGARGAHIYEHFPSPSTPLAKSEATIRSTLAHELAHGIAERTRTAGQAISGGTKAWFEEGIAVYFEHKFTGVDEAGALQQLSEAMKAAGGGPDEGLILGPFHNVAKSVNMNYLFASFMMRRLVAKKGEGIIKTTNQAMCRPLGSDDVTDFDEHFTQLAGMKPSELFAETQAYLKGKLH